MKRAFSIAIAVAAIILPRSGQTTDPFEQKLSPDRQIIQALNRLTFGPRPGDSRGSTAYRSRQVDGAAASSGSNRRKPRAW